MTGLQIRDWLYVDDHNRGIELVIKNGRHGETYNIGGNNEWANIDVVNLLCELIDSALRRRQGSRHKIPRFSLRQSEYRQSHLITYVTDRPGHDTRYAINASKIMTELGYDPQEDFDSGLNKTIDWYLSNRIMVAVYTGRILQTVAYWGTSILILEAVVFAIVNKVGRY